MSHCIKIINTGDSHTDWEYAEEFIRENDITDVRIVPFDDCVCIVEDD